MKTLKYFGILSMMLVCAMAFTACSDDDDDSLNINDMSVAEIESLLVGKWSVLDEFVEGGERGKETWIHELSADGRDRNYEVGYEDEAYTGSWRVYKEDGKVYLYLDGEDCTIVNLSQNRVVATYGNERYDYSGTYTMTRMK